MNGAFTAPRKSLGQNFLQDPNIVRKIVAGLNIKSTDVVLEIGPGRGALTELILPLARVAACGGIRPGFMSILA